MLKIGIVGCGAIGSQICRSIDADSDDIQIYAVSDHNIDFVCALKEKLKHMKPEFLTIEEMVEHVDLVVESASQKAVSQIIPPALKAGCDVMIMSIGALADSDFREYIYGLARNYNCRIYLPSGSITGIDGLKSAMSGEIYSVTLTTKKPPSGLTGAPYIVDNEIDLERIESETLIFEGNAAKAVESFPANVNVAATLSIAGIGFERTKVRIIADPHVIRNIHEIEVEGEFGKFTTRTENIPSPTNPKTSYLASLSAIATLKKIANPLQIGT